MLLLLNNKTSLSNNLFDNTWIYQCLPSNDAAPYRFRSCSQAIYYFMFSHMSCAFRLMKFLASPSYSSLHYYLSWASESSLGSWASCRNQVDTNLTSINRRPDFSLAPGTYCSSFHNRHAPREISERMTVIRPGASWETNCYSFFPSRVSLFTKFEASRRLAFTSPQVSLLCRRSITMTYSVLAYFSRMYAGHTILAIYACYCFSII